ncbi:MAG: SLBB domain-containing protein, partial [Calditrichota bacterium]
MKLRLPAVISLLLLSFLGTLSAQTAQTVTEQDLPESARQELQKRGMTVQEARRQAEMLGINLDNPQEALWRARELGIPESTINDMLDAVQRAQSTMPGAQGVQRLGYQDSLLMGYRPAQRPDTLQAKAIPADTLLYKGDTLIVTRDSIRFQNNTFVRQDTTKLKGGLKKLPYFGYSFFQNIPDAFQPGQMGPVEGGYIVSPGDELRLSVWGATEFQYDLQVDREGRIFIPNAGQLTVAGKSLEDLRKQMKTWLSKNYSGLVSEPPTAFMDLTVTRLRPIYVYVLGDVKKPGGYTVSSYSTVFNVLYSVGGPMTSGSLRDIRVIRNGKVVEHVDMYDYLLRGFESKPVRLQNNDRIFIPPRGKTVSIRGPVKREAIFELKEDEGFRDLLEFAGGLKPEAYVKRFQITRIIPFTERTNPSVAREVIDQNLSDVLKNKQHIPLYDGDQVSIPSILSQIRNSAKIAGAVRQPGQYELKSGLRTVRDLIIQADSLTGDAYMNKADLVRIQSDSTRKMLSINLDRAMEFDPDNNLRLQPLDSLYVYSTIELVQVDSVMISGYVRNPGTYAYMDSMTVQDLLYKGGGLQDPQYLKNVYLPRADLFRRTEDGMNYRIIPFNLSDALRGRGMAGMALQPKDEIRIYPRGVKEFVLNKKVHISGAVKAPGDYPYRENMNLEDLILQAGGFSEGAYLENAEVTRIMGEDQEVGEKAISMKVPLIPARFVNHDLSFGVADSIVALQNARHFNLQHRDRVYIRQDPSFQPQDTVMVTGEVRYPGQYTLLQENESLYNLLSRAGGVLPTGYPKGGRLI